jgi:hypothetical protein
MEMKKDNAQFVQIVQRALLALALMATVMTAAPAMAQGGCDRDRKGLFLGFNAGWGGAAFGSATDDNSTTDKANHGAAGSLRFGYAFSNSFALSLEGYGFGSYQGDEDWGLGAGFLTVTWWPDGSGFFLRLGFGEGGGDILRRETGELVHFEEKGAGLIGLGYEFQLGRKFALGVAVDGIGFDLEGASGLEDDMAGMGVFSIQFNWYL